MDKVNIILETIIDDLKRSLKREIDASNFHAKTMKEHEENCIHLKILIPELEQLRDIRKNDRQA